MNTNFENMKTMWSIILLVLLLVGCLTILGFSAAPMFEKPEKVYDRKKLLRYQLDSFPKQTQAIAESRYKKSPPLRPERFRRRMKMMWGIDVEDYPQKALVFFGPDFKLSLDHQIITGFFTFHGDEPLIVPPPPEDIYTAFGRYFLYADRDSYDILEEYIRIRNDGDYSSCWSDEFLRTIYYTSMSSQPQLIQYMDSMRCTEIFSHELDIFINYEDYSRSEEYLSAFRVSEIKKDLLYLYIKKEEAKGRIVRSIEHRTKNMIDLGFAVDEGTYLIPFYSGSNPWHADTRARSESALLAFLLQLQHKSQRKYVIRYMSGQTDLYSYKEQEQKVRAQIRSNNYYGHAILREFWENPEREMPTMEKIGTSFKGMVTKPNTLLYLEPYPDSYDIDILQPTETFTAYEMGYDDYYFIEVVKPVESLVAGPDGYAMILDRTEIVYGYLLKSDVKEYTEADKFSPSLIMQSGKSKQGVINDPDGYVNIRKETNSTSEIAGQLKEKEVFSYWEIPESNWWLVHTVEGIRGFVHQSRIKEKLESGGWILDE